MPYFREFFINDSVKAGVNNSYLTVLDMNRVTSFRTSPHPSSLHTQLLSDASVDPYAYFLTSNVTRDYHAALEARGLPARGRPDMGHPFESVRHTITGSRHNSRWGGAVQPNSMYYYGGTGLDAIHNGNFSKLPTFESDSLGTFARQAYNRVAPTSVVFDAANFLGELHERLPSIAIQSFKRDANLFRAYGSDYLNIAFGWKPFVDEILNAARALGKATQELSGNGKRVHRSYTMLPLRKQDAVLNFGQFDVGVGTGTRLGEPLFPSDLKKVLGYPSPLSTSATSASFNTKSGYKSYERTQWFEGEFSSFFPLDFDPSNYFDKLNLLVNTKLTPETLWNLAPWSWLADWTLRIGDNIGANLNAANDLLIMHYGYAMEKTVYKTFGSFGKPTNFAGESHPSWAWSTVTTTRKRRIRANPYGFGVGGAAALSGSQLSILGAAALTMLPRK